MTVSSSVSAPRAVPCDATERISARTSPVAAVSIIVPARDEALVLPGCFQSLLKQDYAGQIRIIVVDNGSTDGTPELAGQWAARFQAAGHELVVLKLQEGNKPAALNAGDAAATGACRIYLDADTELSPNCVSSIVATLACGSPIALCCARMQIVPARSWVTRRYARVWSRLPWVSDDVIGGGLYAVSAAGRQRWGAFPNVIADDMWAQAHFRLHERRVIPDARFHVRLPEGFRNLVRVRTRWVRGNHEVARHINGYGGRVAFPFRGRIKALLLRPWLWPDLPLYFTINLLALWRARRRDSVGTSQWERGRPRKTPPPALDSLEPATASKSPQS